MQGTYAAADLTACDCKGVWYVLIVLERAQVLCFRVCRSRYRTNNPKIVVVEFAYFDAC